MEDIIEYAWCSTEEHEYRKPYSFLTYQDSGEESTFDVKEAEIFNDPIHRLPFDSRFWNKFFVTKQMIENGNTSYLELYLHHQKIKKLVNSYDED